MLGKRSGKGAVYWHAQNEQDFLSDGSIKGGICIGFVGHTDEIALNAASDLIFELEALGMPFEWDGTVDQKITVLPRTQRVARSA